MLETLNTRYYIKYISNTVVHDNQQLSQRDHMKINRYDLTQSVLHEFLDYNPKTGELTWKKKYTRKVVVGQRAGSISTKNRHRVLRFMGELYAEHRVAWFHYYGKWPDGHIDHVNHNEQDNRIENLRDVTQAENNRNTSKRKDNSTGHVGVWLNKLNSKKKFMAELYLSGKRVHYSSHYTLEEAIAARKSAEQIYGFHPNHGMDKPAESSTTIKSIP